MTLSDEERAERYLDRHGEVSAAQLAGGIGIPLDAAQALLSTLTGGEENALEFPFEDFWYIRARGPDDKRPAESWGGYSQSFEEASCVYTYEEVQKHPSTDWLLNAWRPDDRMDHQLLIFDIDVHKAPDDFDADRIGVPDDTPLVKSQSGGFHVYFLVNSTLDAKESDFEVVQDIPFDIDIRGELVKHHVVAPGDLPGVENGYSLIQDESIMRKLDPESAARSITLDGSPLLRFNSGTGGRGGGYERDEVDPPEDIPKCYGTGLTLRHEAPDDTDLNSHKVNVLTALSGLGHGYDVETVVDHYVDDFYPGDSAAADREKTRYQVEHIAEKLDAGEYSPPTVLTMQEYGILPSDEWCYCGLPGHSEVAERRSVFYNHDLEALSNANGLDGDPYEDDRTLLLTCLHARDELGLEEAKPPYSALVEIAEVENLPFAEYEERILGQRTYETARRIFKNAPPSEFSNIEQDETAQKVEEFLTELELSE